MSKACEILCISSRTLQRWRKTEAIEDKRKKTSLSPVNKISEIERKKILNMLGSTEFGSSHKSVHNLGFREPAHAMVVSIQGGW